MPSIILIILMPSITTILVRTIVKMFLIIIEMWNVYANNDNAEDGINVFQKNSHNVQVFFPTKNVFSYKESKFV